MKLRSWFPLMIILATAAFPGAIPAAPQTVPTPALPAIPSADPLNGFPESYVPISGTPFGDGCHICPDDILQGELDDCYLLSSLAAIAIVSPGTIQNAIMPVGKDAAGNTVYTVRLSSKEVKAESAFPGLKSPGGLLDLISSKAYASTAYWGSLIHGQSFFYYAQPPSDGSALTKLKNSNGVIWPMIMEEAYAATLTENDPKTGQEKKDPKTGKPIYVGYAGYKGGGISYLAMQTITGAPGGGYIVDPKGPPTSPAVVKSVFIHDSPALADVGGHSILGGLLRGDLKAIQPNLMVCASPSGGRSARNCTQICPESHSCRQTFAGGGVPLTTDQNNVMQKLHIVVFDVDRPGSEHNLYESDLVPATCAEATPCNYSLPNSQYVIAGPLVISFVVIPAGKTPLGEGVKGVLTTTAEIDSTLTQLQSQHRAVTAGTVALCGGRSQVCDQSFDASTPGHLEHGHDYFLKQYDHATGTVVLGNPHGTAVSVPLAAFLQTFYQIGYNEVPVQKSACGCN
jgi:hypothetical protein